MSATSTVRIGLSTYRQEASWSVWTSEADLLPTGYADSIYATGALPMLLPPGGADPDAWADRAMSTIDGLVLTGGVDVDPALYGAERGPLTDPSQPHRDAWEAALCRSALRHETPVLAVCRGLHVLNVALGGTLTQHLPDAVGHDGHRPVVGQFPRHHVRVAEGSALVAMVGDEADVPTHHHQAVDALGAGLEAIGWADDGIIEAVSGTGACWVVGVQWHPEMAQGHSLFDALVEQAAASREAKAAARSLQPGERMS